MKFFDKLLAFNSLIVISVLIIAIIVGLPTYILTKYFGFENAYTKIYMYEPLEKRVKIGFLENKENCKFTFQEKGDDKKIVLDFSKDIESFATGKNFEKDMFYYVRTMDGKKYAIQIITSNNYQYFNDYKIKNYISECSLKYNGEL